MHRGTWNKPDNGDGSDKITLAHVAPSNVSWDPKWITYLWFLQCCVCI